MLHKRRRRRRRRRKIVGGGFAGAKWALLSMCVSRPATHALHHC
jgi:hypothetical protein